MHRCTSAFVGRSLIMLIAAAALAGCVHDENGVHLAGPTTTAAQPAATAQSAPAPQAVAAAPASAVATAPAEPEEPETQQHASAVCWMKYEHGRRDLSLDKRMKLVDVCIDERLKASR